MTACGQHVLQQFGISIGQMPVRNTCCVPSRHTKYDMLQPTLCVAMLLQLDTFKPQASAAATHLSQIHSMVDRSVGVAAASSRSLAAR
jgi:hypothetical protein